MYLVLLSLHLFGVHDGMPAILHENIQIQHLVVFQLVQLAVNIINIFLEYIVQ